MATTLSPTAQPEPPPASDPAPKGRGWFRAFWRWHFYGSFLVIPVLLVLAVTGLIYLFRFEIEPALQPGIMTVEAPEAAVASDMIGYEEQLQAVGQAYPDVVVGSMAEPRAADRATVFTGESADGQPRDVFVNPWTGEVLGARNPDTTLSGYAVRLHGDLMTPPWGDYLIELVACWAIVMAITGYVIFVQGRKARTRRLVARKPGAALRYSHGLIGAVLGIGLLGLLVTGLPWTALWGENAQRLATGQGTSLWSMDPGAVSDPASRLDESLPHSHDVPWALGATEVPVSGGPGAGSVATADTAVAVAAREGVQRPMTVVLPGDDGGVFSAIGYAFNDPGQEQTVHVDQYGATVVARYGYADYPALAQVVSQGIALHEGRRFGLVSFWGAAAFCLGIIFMCVTGPVMWWRRRPEGPALGAPRGRMPLRTTPLLVAALAVLGILLPLFGASLLLLLALDHLVLRRVPALGRWFAVT